MYVNDEMAPTLIQAVVDSIKFNQALLDSETLRNVEDHEEYLMSLGALLMHLEDEYRRVEDEVGVPLSRLVPNRDDG